MTSRYRSELYKYKDVLFCFPKLTAERRLRLSALICPKNWLRLRNHVIYAWSISITIQLEPGSGRDSIRLLMTVDYLDHSDAESDPIPDPHCERKNCFNV